MNSPHTLNKERNHRALLDQYAFDLAMNSVVYSAPSTDCHLLVRPSVTHAGFLFVGQRNTKAQVGGSPGPDEGLVSGTPRYFVLGFSLLAYERKARLTPINRAFEQRSKVSAS